MSLTSALESLNLSSFRSRTRRGRCPPTRKLDLEPLEGRTLLSAVHPLFDLSAVTTSPFPSNRFTVADDTQNTGRRVRGYPVTFPCNSRYLKGTGFLDVLGFKSLSIR